MAQFFIDKGKLIDLELDKLDGDIEIAAAEPQTEAELRNLEQFPLQKIIELYPKIGLQLKEDAFEIGRASCRERV